MSYDPADNARKSYEVAIDALREQVEACERVQIGDATLYCGDCKLILPTLGRVDALLATDPPYGIAHASNYTCRTTTAGWMNSEIANDADTSVRDSVLQGHDGDWICFGSDRVAAPKSTRGTLVCDKGPASGMGDLSFPWKRSFELIFVGGAGWNGHRDEGVVKGHHIVTRASMGRVHPNEKPVSLMCYLIGKATAETILDPFMGTATTGAACARLGRRFIGIEIERRYFDIACRRIEETYAQPDLFVAPAPAVPEMQQAALALPESDR